MLTSPAYIKVQKDHILTTEERSILHVGLSEAYVYGSLCLCITVTQEINVIRTTPKNRDRIDYGPYQSRNLSKVLQEKFRYSLLNAEFLGEIGRIFDPTSSERLLKIYLIGNKYETTVMVENWEKHTGIYQEPEAKEFLGLLIYEADVGLYRLFEYIQNMSVQIQSEVLNQDQLNSIIASITNYCENVIEHKNSVVAYCNSGPNTPLYTRTFPPNANGLVALREYNPKNLKRKNRVRFVKKLNEHFAYFIDKILVVAETFKPCIPNSQANAVMLKEIARWKPLLLSSKIQFSQVDAQILNGNSVILGFNLGPSNIKHWKAYNNITLTQPVQLGTQTSSSTHVNMLHRTISYPDVLNNIPHGGPFYSI